MRLAMLDKLRIAKYRFSLEAVDTLRLPVYKGGTLRGGFGQVFKRTLCYQPQVRECTGCLLRGHCAYAYIFETAPSEDAEVLRNLSDVPLPFVIEPPLDRRTSYTPGQMLDFGLVLVGRAIEYLPYFIVVFRELGREGIGRGRRKYALGQVTALHPTNGERVVIYDGQDLMPPAQEMTLTYEQLAERAESLPEDEIAVHFLTPTRLKHKGEYVEKPEFHILLRAVMRRVSSLYYFHCGERWDTDYRGTIEVAKAVEVAQAGTGWVDWERYSRRQGWRMNLGGFVGEMRYSGNLRPFLPILALGEWVHVGKACVFGNGQYVIQ